MREPYLYESPLCAQVDSELFFPEKDHGKSTAQVAKSICSRCIHKDECLEWAVTNNEEFGIWGGTTERARALIRRTRAKRSA